MKYHGAWFAAAIAGLIPVGALPAAAETIAVFTKSAGNPISRAVRAGAEAVAKANGVTVFHYIPTSADNVPQQTALVDEALSAKRDAFVFTPVDVKAMVPPVQKVNAANIPLVNVSDRLAGGSAVAFIGTDDYGIALETARTLLKAMGGKGNVVILEGPDNRPAGAVRVKGLKDALKEFPDVKLLASKSANYARTSAADVMKGFLRSYSQIDGVLAANDPMAIGAVDALKAANKRALVAGINGSMEVLDLIKSGDILASGDYNGFVQGCLGAEVAVRQLRKLPVPNELVLTPVVVDKSSYQPYETPMEQRTCPTLDSVAGK